MFEEKIKLDDKVIYKNKESIKRKQYSLSIQPEIIDRIIKIQQGLQLLVDAPILRGEIIENILIKGLNAGGEAIIVDNEAYNFQDLIVIQKWCENDLIKDFIKQLSTIQGIKKVEKDAKLLYQLHDYKDEIDEEVDINNIDNKMITNFIYALWDNYLLADNQYYRIRNFRYIQSMSLLPEIIKAILHLYRKIEIQKNNYSKIKEIIKGSYGKVVDEKDYNNLIIKLGINSVLEKKEFNKKMFEEEYWIKSKSFKYHLEISIEHGIDYFDIKKDIEDGEEK